MSTCVPNIAKDECETDQMLGVGNESLTIPWHNEHFTCFPKNSLNQGFRYNKPAI